MKLQQSMAAMIAAGSLILTLSAPRTGAATRYVWQDSPSPGPPYTNWSTAAHEIQPAVDAASPGETVLVTNGVYTAGAVAVGDNQTNRVALTAPVVLRSVNGPDVTVIQGAAAPDGGNGDGSIRCVYVGTNAILSGFTLTNGHAIIGGGVWCEASGVVTNCTLTGNSASDGGGAVGGTFYNCTLASNSAYSGGGAAWSTLYNCSLIENLAIPCHCDSSGCGGGAYYCTLDNCTLTRNSGQQGGGAYGGTLNKCTLTGNTGWGAYYSILYNCALTGNSGGGVIRGTLYNCTVTGNSNGGAAYSTLYNCIVYHNTAGDALNHSDSTFEYSCTTPLPTNGVGNIEADPQLASASHLSSSSPCIGTGSVTYSTGVDIDGEPWANPPCIGVDQLTPGSAIGLLTLQIQASDTYVKIGYVVSFTAQNTGPILQSVWDFGDGTRLTNQPFASHAWTAPGDYNIRLTGYNDSFPGGVTTSLVVTVSTAVFHVNRSSTNSVFPYASWETAATNIQDAVDAAAFPGSLVLVTNGIYDVGGGVNGSRVALTNPVVLRSVNGPEGTTIAGSGDWEVGVMRCVYVGANAMLSGFTLTNGYSWEGGGVWCESSGMVSNCAITGNSLRGGYGSGGGAFGGTLYNCTLAGNQAPGGGLHFTYGGGAANATLFNCILTKNSADNAGGAVWSTLKNSTLTANSAQRLGGGVGESTLYNCTLSGNSATYGGGAYGGVLNNCVLTGNAAAYGGGAAYGVTLNNCTLTANSAETGGGAYNAILYNCVVYYNAAGNGPNHFGATLDYSCTTPLPTNGVGNIDADPLFVNPAVGDLHLRPDSPCIDAGTNLSAILTTDLDGLPRPLDGNGDGVARFDMGAYEFNPYRFAPTLQLSTNGFQFTVRGEPGKSVRIERSRDLVHWEFVGQMPIPASGQGEMHDPAAHTEPQMFYRAVSMP